MQKIQNPNMGKPINIFEQRKNENNVIDIFNMKNNTGW